ncbi:mRNA-degrading endonuclease [Spirochaetia bacterium]|nr:mRNA-degrading endonuclease [Spirochaetia bacterium]
MVDSKYVPDRGDILWLNFNPQSGHALVISPKEYNEKVGLGLFCPITSKIKQYPFEVRIKNKVIDGVVLSDQIKSLDWKGRDAKFIIKSTAEELKGVIEKLNTLVFE